MQQPSTIASTYDRASSATAHPQVRALAQRILNWSASRGFALKIETHKQFNDRKS